VLCDGQEFNAVYIGSKKGERWMKQKTTGALFANGPKLFIAHAEIAGI
jgi:hypothetical protein